MLLVIVKTGPAALSQLFGVINNPHYLLLLPSSLSFMFGFPLSTVTLQEFKVC